MSSSRHLQVDAAGGALPASDGPRPGYLSSYRRVLIDTHIPDWDERFLRDFDPARSVREAAAAGASGIMVYFQSHTGLCNWATRTGRQHRALVGRDVMSDCLRAAREAGLPACAYYSVNFNNWACESHPEWRLRPAAAEVIGGGLLQRERYGICCLNNGDYTQFVAAQTREILHGYDVDAFFFDMVWWMSVCLCDSCRDRHRRESGRELPEVVDWLDPDWCSFQAARERWLVGFATGLRDIVHRVRPEIPVYHNFALGAANWTKGVSFESARAHDFLGGDFYGGTDEQLLISRLMLNLSERRPVEFMTTVASNLAEHERLKPQAVLDSQCLAATASHAAFLAILAHDPEGGVNPAALGRVRQMFAVAQPYERYLGGRPVEDIGVYFSSASKMSFVENGVPLSQAARQASGDYPHLLAVSGACRVLQEAHLPFGVITRRQLPDLGRYRVVVLPNVLRMDEDEVAAIRDYVRNGGRLYASRYSSLTSTAGVRHRDFMLADVLGCHFESVESGRNLYLTPVTGLATSAIAPERHLSHWLDPAERTGALRLGASAEGRALLTLTLPCGYPGRGTVGGHDWASIHSFPPWERTTTPVVVEHDYGGGRAVYSAVDLESGHTASHDALFRALIGDLLGADSAYRSNAHPAVWMTVFDQPDQGRWIVSFANQSGQVPALPVPGFDFHLSPPPGRRITGLRRLPQETEEPCQIADDGSMTARVTMLESFAMYSAELT